MSIELLWIIPIVAFSFFIFLIVYNISKKIDNPYKELSNEVARFNNGMHQPVQLQITPEKRLDELEKAILSVNESIANQQKLMERVNVENSPSSEIEDLRKKLHELQKEYDIVISENYSLRAKVKYLIETKETSAEDKTAFTGSSKTSHIQNSKGKINLKLYEDTRLMSLTQIENMEENDKSDVG